MLRRSGPGPRPTTLSRAGLAAVTLRAAVFGLTSPSAATLAGDAAGGYVAVIEVSGLLDDVLVDFIETEIDQAEDAGAIALVLQLNSSGAVVGEDRLDQLLERMAGASVPVDVWVGPSGSRATGDAANLLAAARVVGVA